MNPPSLLEEHPLWLSHYNGEEIPYPDIVQLELTASCDLRCVMCPLPHEQRYGTGNERFDVEDLERHRDLFTAASGVELTGFGEILCHPHLLDCLRWFRKMNLSIQATTNGNLLTDRLVRAIHDEQLIDAMCISIDAVSEEAYRLIRCSGDFRALRKNIASFSEQNRGRQTRMYLSFAAMEPNIRELPAFVRWAHELGAERVIVQHIFEAPHTKGWGLQHHRCLAAGILAEAGAIADELGMILDGRNLPEQGAAGYRVGMIKDCSFPWRHTFVKANRRIAACAMVWEDLDFGDLNDGFAATWNGQAYRRFRRAMASTIPPAPCVRCQYFGWREPTNIEELADNLTMHPTQRGRLGWGWHDAEYDANGKYFRWSRAQSSAFLKPNGKAVLEIDAIVHPQAPFLRGVICVGKNTFPFDSNDFFGAPLRLSVGASHESPVIVEIKLDQPWNPGPALGIAGMRKIGLLVYGMQFVGDPFSYQSKIEALDEKGQLCRGWLPPENISGKWMRWTRESASLLLPLACGELVIAAQAPLGLKDRKVSVVVDGNHIGETYLHADGLMHELKFNNEFSDKRLSVIELVIEGAAPSTDDHSENPRLFGMLVSSIGFIRSS